MAAQPQQPSDQPAPEPNEDVPTDARSESELPAAPHPGSKDMPPWNVAELPDAPTFRWKQWTMLLGPGLLMGGAAIGGGEWLTGPIVTARYGGAMLWLATLSVLGQVIYNIEISRYTLYSGEPIFTGKFRTMPGPKFWIIAYLLLDFGSFFPYLAASAAMPLFTAINGELPFISDDPAIPDDKDTLRWIGIAIFVASMIPLIFGGKIYNSLKHIMMFKIVTVLGFLTVVAIFYSTVDTWKEIGSGFFKFGTVPIRAIEDSNGNGVLDEGEDWDSDGRLDVIEPGLRLVERTDPETGPPIEFKVSGADGTIQIFQISDLPVETPIDTDRDGSEEGPFEITQADLDRKYLDLDGDGTQDGDNVDNIFTAAAAGRELPPIDWSLVAFLSALVAISGSGGLSNTPVSNYTRDQGWGMGKHVGAIPGMVGGHDLALSHTGTVFHPDEESMPRWRRWYRHIMRDQLVIWMPACFLGLALPCMLSVQFLDRGTTTENKWDAPVMTAEALRDAVGGGSLGTTFWFGTLLCGFLILAPSMAVSADGIIRRWVDAFWTASAKLRELDPKAIKQVYFGVVVVYMAFGLTMLSLGEPVTLLLIATTIYNFALGLSCWHVLWVNVAIMPKPLRPGWPIRAALFCAGSFYLFVATVSTLQRFVWSA
jgi:hypothetical protein